MRNDERFEIERAFDLLPHVVGASWASVWFRMMGIRRPERQEFRDKAAEYLRLMEPVFDSYLKEAGAAAGDGDGGRAGDGGGRFEAICGYIEFRKNREYERIVSGDNGEIEKRYDRYVDYG